MEIEKPTTKTFALDSKDAKYYRDRFLNNCSMRNRYVTRLKNNINVFNQNLEQIEKLDTEKDPFFTHDEEFTKKLRDFVDNVNQAIEDYCTALNDEYTELKAKDYESIVKKNEEEIREKESNQQHTEIK